jgi:CxxC-x17-CxxC domain-containing protein
VDIDEEERHDFYLYVDEFQNFATESFANILSEARKYRLNLILANQYIMQIDEKVRDAIFGNAGTLISFRVGASDAEFLEKEFEPVFMMNDIVNLPKYNIYIKLMIDGIAGNAFSATTIPPVDIEKTKSNKEKVIRVSRERYASSCEEVEDKIKRWSGMMMQEKAKEIASEREDNYPQKFRNSAQIPNKTNYNSNFNSVSGGNGAIETKEKIKETVVISKEIEKVYDAICDTCGTSIKIPFKPDGKRPTFCKECFKDYQRVLAKARNESKKDSEKDNLSSPKAEEKKQTISANKIEPKTFVSNEKPINLSQLQYFAPKKFKPNRKKPSVNLEELRTLINKNRDETE